MSFFEEYLSKEIDFGDEINKIEYLLKKQYPVFGSIYGNIDGKFLTWKLRRTCVSLKEFMNDSEINKVITKAKTGENIQLHEFLDYIEFVSTIERFYGMGSPYNGVNYDAMRALDDNLEIVLNKINFEVVFVGQNFEDSYAKCIEKDLRVREAAEIVEDKNIAEKVYLYNHHSMKGNLFEKAIILSRLYMNFEEYRKNLENNGFKDMCSVLGHLSDKMNVRHKPNAKEGLVISGFTEQEIEQIYDRMYKDYLSTIILDDYVKNKSFLKDVSKKFN